MADITTRKKPSLGKGRSAPPGSGESLLLIYRTPSSPLLEPWDCRGARSQRDMSQLVKQTNINNNSNKILLAYFQKSNLTQNDLGNIYQWGGIWMEPWRIRIPSVFKGRAVFRLKSQSREYHGAFGELSVHLVGLEPCGWREKHVRLKRLLGAGSIHACWLSCKFASLVFREDIWKGFILSLPPFWFFIYHLMNSLIQQIFIKGTGRSSNEQCSFLESLL